LYQLLDDLLVYLQKFTTTFAYQMLVQRLGVWSGEFVAVHTLSELELSQKTELAQEFYSSIDSGLAYPVSLLNELSVDIFGPQMPLSRFSEDLQNDLPLGSHSVLF